MLIDWFTVGAQALNFVILVWLMKHFLYNPVLNAIDAREKKIAGRIADAEKREADAVKEKADFKQKNDAIDQQRAELLKKATDEAAAERSKLIEAAKKAADDLAAQRKVALRSEARDLSTSIRKRTAQEVFAITRSTLKDMASSELEERMCAVFIERLTAMDDKAKKPFAEAIRTAPDPPLVRSAFDLPEKQQKALQKAVNKTFGSHASLRYETRPDLVAGIELSANGQKISWSIDDHLDWLSSNVDAILGKSASTTTVTASPTTTPTSTPPPTPPTTPTTASTATPITVPPTTPTTTPATPPTTTPPTTPPAIPTTTPTTTPPTTPTTTPTQTPPTTTAPPTPAITPTTTPTTTPPTTPPPTLPTTHPTTPVSTPTTTPPTTTPPTTPTTTPPSTPTITPTPPPPTTPPTTETTTPKP